MIILVVGMHRSGTSLVARGLHAMGVNLGSRVDTTPDPANPYGHWEHADVWYAQEQLLTRFGREWHTSPGPLPARWLEWPDAVATIEQFAQIAGAELAAHGHWLVKDPRSSLLIPLWKDVARRVGTPLRILRLFRDLEEVVASLAARQDMPRELAERIWRQHQRSIDRDAAGLETEMYRHDAILRDPARAFTAMGAFCGLPDAGQRASAAAVLVEPGLWHQRQSVALAGLPADAASEASPSATLEAVGGPTADHGRVLIVMRTRWRQHLLPRAIRSVLSQTYANWFLQVVNDGGLPHLVEREFAPYRHLLEGRIGVLHRDRQHGMEAASNAGIAAAAGAFIAIHDDDDSWSPEFLERMVARLHQTGRGAAASRSRVVHEVWNGRSYWRRQVVDFGPTSETVGAADLARYNLFPPIAFLYRRSVYEAVGPYDEALPSLGDWQFNRRVAARESIDVCPEYLAYWHQRDATDPLPNSSQIDLWRTEESVAGWPDAPPPDFHGQARQVRLWAGGRAFADFPRITPMDVATTDARGLLPVLPPGLYLIQLSLDECAAAASSGRSPVFWYRSSAAFTRNQSLPLSTRIGTHAVVLMNAPDPIFRIGLSDGTADVAALPAASEVVRLSDPLASIERRAEPPRLPDVLCIGAQRSGTTWLHAALQAHPQVWSCPIKEFHHFDWDGQSEQFGAFRQYAAAHMLRTWASGTTADPARERAIRMALRFGFPAAHSWEHYAALFESAPRDQVACDFTPAYATLDEDVVAGIVGVMPDVRVVMILRDPVTRAVSGALHALRLEGILQPTEAQVRDACEATSNVLRTDYLRTLDVWEPHMPPGRLLLLFHEEIARDPMAVIERTCAFLGIARPQHAMHDLAVRCNKGTTSLAELELARIKADLSRRWLPMLEALEGRLGEPVAVWRRAAEARVLATDAGRFARGREPRDQ